MPFDYKAGLERTWTETDGRGSYARGTASGPNTRRDHGLLISRSKDGLDRVLVHQFEEWIIIGDRRYPLSSTIYRDLGSPARVLIHPEGHLLLESFHSAPFPRWVFSLGAHRLIRTIRPLGGEPGLVAEYLLIVAPTGSNPGAATSSSPQDARLEIRPLLSGRGTQDLMRENPGLPGVNLSARGDSLSWNGGHGDHDLHLVWPETASWRPDAHWYRHLRLVADTRDEESVWSPGILEIPLQAECPGWVKMCVATAAPGAAIAAPIVFTHDALTPAAAGAAFRRSICWQDASTAHCVVEPGGGAIDPAQTVWTLLWCSPLLVDTALDALTNGVSSGIDDQPLDVQLAWTLVLAERARRGRRDGKAIAAALGRVDDILEGRHPAALCSPSLLLKVRKPGQSWWDRTGESSPDSWRPFPVDIEALWANALAAAEILAAVEGRSMNASYGRHFLAVADLLRRLYWMPDRATLADTLLLEDGELPGSTDDPPDDRRSRSRRLSSAPVLAQALRFEILPPSRARAVLETTRRLLALESHPRTRREPGTLIGLRAFADQRAGYPLLLAPWHIARARLLPGKPTPELTAAAALRFFSRGEDTRVPRVLDPIPPIPQANPGSPNRFSEAPVAIDALAGLLAATIAQGAS